MVYICEFEFVESGGCVEAFPCVELGHGATFGSDLVDAVGMAADFLRMAVEDHMVNGMQLPPVELGHEPTRGGRVIAVAVSRDLGDIPSVTAAEAARMLGVSTARVAQLVKAGRLESWKVGGTRMVSLASVEARIADDPRPGRPVEDGEN